MKGKKLLKEISLVLHGTVNIFEDTVEQTPEGSLFHDLFTGDCKAIPEELMHREVVCVYGGRAKILEIGIKREDT